MCASVAAKGCTAGPGSACAAARNPVRSSAVSKDAVLARAKEELESEKSRANGLDIKVKSLSAKVAELEKIVHRSDHERPGVAEATLRDQTRNDVDSDDHDKFLTGR